MCTSRDSPTYSEIELRCTETELSHEPILRQLEATCLGTPMRCLHAPLHLSRDTYHGTGVSRDVAGQSQHRRGLETHLETAALDTRARCPETAFHLY